jgi:hypothetical protein
MPYNSGEQPEVGDRVCDRHRRFGIVRSIMRWGGGPWELVIKWDDGTIGVRHTVHEDFELLGRREEEPVSAA